MHHPYTASPLIASQEATFDDCQAFPRDGCGGARDGWRAQARHRDLVVAYRVSQDYRHVAIAPPPDLAGRQSLYLYGAGGAFLPARPLPRRRRDALGRAARRRCPSDEYAA